MSKQDPWYWYKWFPRDYMTSPKVMALTWEEQGIYRFLLDFQWINEGIPADLSKCCAIVRGAKRKSVENVVTTFFTAHPDRSDLLVNERLLSCQRDNQRISKKNSEAGKASGESRKRGTPVERPLNARSQSVEQNTNHAGVRDSREEERRGEYTPLPPESDPPASTQDEGEGLASPQSAEIRHHREYCHKEAKGLPATFLSDAAFRAAWCDWIAHLKAKHHKGLNPPFTTIDRHKRQIAHLGVTDAVWALEEAMRRNLAFPADPAKRPAPATTGGVWDGLSVPATPEQRAAQAVMPRPFRNPFASDKPTEPIPEISAGA